VPSAHPSRPGPQGLQFPPPPSKTPLGSDHRARPGSGGSLATNTGSETPWRAAAGSFLTYSPINNNVAPFWAFCWLPHTLPPPPHACCCRGALRVVLASPCHTPHYPCPRPTLPPLQPTSWPPTCRPCLAFNKTHWDPHPPPHTTHLCHFTHTQAGTGSPHHLTHSALYAPAHAPMPTSPCLLPATCISACPPAAATRVLLGRPSFSLPSGYG